MPAGFSVEKASQVYGPTNATEVIPANFLPDRVPYSGTKPTGSASTSASPKAEDNELNIDIAGSSVTAFIMKK